MRLVDRLSQNSAGAPAPEAAGGSLRGGTTARKRDDIGEGSRRLKIRVHNRLLEMLDVSKLDALERRWCRARLRPRSTTRLMTRADY